jgi:hypothetical protein
MPSIIFEPTGDWQAVNKTHSNRTTARDASTGTLVSTGNERLGFTRKSSGQYTITRGILKFDFRRNSMSGAQIRRLKHIHIVGARLNTTFSSLGAGDTGGNIIRLQHLFTPGNYGSIATTDYDRSRHQFATSEITVSNALVTMELDDRRILRELQRSLNAGRYFYLVMVNKLDYDNSNIASTNKFNCEDFNSGSPKPELTIHYRTLNHRKFTGTQGGRRASSSGFGSASITAGTSGGFS